MGFDGISTIETNNKGETDKNQIEFAISEKRTILTFNVKDFVLLYNKLSLKKINHYGIIVSSHIKLKELIKRILKLLNRKSSEDMINSIEFLNKDAILPKFL